MSINEIVLRCGCKITENGEYVVSMHCKNCKECNTVSKLHPFGSERIVNIDTM